MGQVNLLIIRQLLRIKRSYMAQRRKHPIWPKSPRSTYASRILGRVIGSADEFLNKVHLMIKGKDIIPFLPILFLTFSVTWITQSVVINKKVSHLHIYLNY